MYTKRNQKIKSKKTKQKKQQQTTNNSDDNIENQAFPVRTFIPFIPSGSSSAVHTSISCINFVTDSTWIQLLVFEKPIIYKML